ncbi:MAG TPA: RNA polymerase sigma factor [Bacteroidales bacterium]|nr:RNA polymerase sigma factor [Bacteroidales bacterium]
MDDRLLIQRIKDGDISAVSQMVNNHRNLIWHIIISMTGRNSDNEDLFQEVFLRVFKGIRKFREEAKLSTWIGSIAHHVCVDYLRKKKLNSIYTDIENDFKAVQNIKSEFATNEHEDLNKLLLSAIEKLPPAFRTVITLFHLDDHSYRDISIITGMPEGTVKSYISRGRDSLRQILTQAVPDIAEIMNQF